MKIKWFGHSCFLLTSESGVKVLTDPFNNQVGYRLPVVEADIVTTSHGHYDHNYIQVVNGKFKHLDKPGVFEQDGIRITGVSTFHDEVQGAKRGKNIIYIFDIDGLRICHCGDLGYVPSKEQAAVIGRIDILLLPVGGIFTVNTDEAMKVMELLKPKLTIPMHFRTPRLLFPLNGVDKFLSAAGITGQEAYANRQEIDVTPDSLGILPRIIVFNYE
ncbi:MAG: MBL fold metallo-hydrolase [Ruminiclostridium sp.]|nr:MBL fold metallo-hydrolase [Ruminiclostridium sp.]